MTFADPVSDRPGYFRRSIRDLIVAPLRSAILGVVVATGAVWANPALAANQSFEVIPGRSVELARSTKNLTVDQPQLGKVTQTLENSKPAAMNVLTYVAPSNVSEADVDVNYKIADQPNTAVIHVRAPPPSLTSDKFYETSFRVLLALFVLAVVLESALALLFRWRPFLTVFDSRTVNSIIAFVVAYILVKLFKLDLVSSLVNTYSDAPHAESFPGYVLTAMIIAGGSAGVNHLLQTLGLRPIGDGNTAPPKPPPTKAWIAVRLQRTATVGPVAVLIGETEPLPVAGTITGSASKFVWLRPLLRDKGRFPASGGFEVKPGVAYTVRLEGKKADGSKVVSEKWGPYPLTEGAIVDLVLSA